MSTIIIRLQNLPLSAKAADIREFFDDLKIPKGSVNIVGGPMGDAFIGFASDEDARLAMLLEGRLLHNAKIRLMLSSRREMDQVIANAQSQAVKPSGAPPEAPDQQHDVVVPAASKLQTQYSTMTMPKNEVVSTSATNIASTSLSAFPFGQPLQPTFQQTLPPPQSASIGGPPQPSYSSFSGGDSWKTPQQSFPSLTTHQISQSVQPPPQIAQQPTLPPVFPGPIGNAIHGPPPPQPHQVPHYQQLPQQPPGFPPPLGLPPGPNGGQQKSTTGFQQPLPNFGRPSSGNNSGDNFFNQPVLQPAVGAGIPTFFGPGPQRFPPPHFGQTYAAPAPPGQQQKPQFFGGPTGGGHFRQPGQQHKQQQQQFGQRAPNQSHFGNQQSNFASAQHRQPRQEGASGGNYRAGKFGQQTQQQQQPFAAQTHQKTFYSVGSGDGGGGGAVKRRRSRTPDDTTNKRFNAAQPRFAPGRQGSANSNQQSRICIQLSNVPFKATFDEVQDYLSASKVKGVKATRVYLPDRNFSDRWIVEFDNENEAKTLIRSRGMINGRTIRVERIDPRRADEQYAIQEPDEADGDNRGGGRSRRDESRKEGGTRRENIKRERTQNRDRSRSKERTEKSATIPERQHQPQQQEDRPASQETSSIWERGRRPSSRIEENRDVNGEEWSLREEAQLPPASSPPKETPTNEMATTDSRPSSKSVSSHHPVPLSEAFGAFSFPATQTNAVYNAKSGTTVQLGAKDGMKPIPLRSFDAAPPQFFPCHPNSAGTGPFHRPPPLFNIASSNNNQRSAAPNGDDNGQKIGNVSAAAGGHFQPNVASQWPVQSANADALPSPHFRHSAKTSSPPQHKPSNAGTGANAIPVSGQWPFSGTQQHRDDNTADSSAAKSPSSSTSHFSHENAAPNTSRTKLVVQENLSEVDNDQRSDVHLRTDFDGRQRDDNNTAGQESRHLATSTFFGPSPAATDNIGPFSAPFPIKSEAEHAAESHQPPPDPRPPQTQRMMEFSPQRRAFDSTPITLSCNEFSPQEVELRPHLLFLEHYRQDPNANTCIRLENVPKMVFVEQLSEFLDVTIESPCQNIARMHNGVLYINLENELFASKAASKNCLFLYGNQIGITQLRKAEMADAIRQNMIIIRELYRVTVVARGFPLMVQPIEVVKLFERFNVNRDGVEKCAVKATDTISTYLLTFPSVQDCRNAIRELNGTITSGGTRIQVFQPEGLGI